MSHQRELIPMRPEDLLRHERQQKGLSIERVARESRIRPSVIEAIESGETAHIPSVYLKGYVRQYARHLGLDPAEFENLVEEVEGAKPEVRPVFSNPARKGAAEKWIKVSSYLAASVMIAALAWQFTHEAVRFSQNEHNSPDTGENRSARAETGPAPLNGKRHLSASIAPVTTADESGAMISAHPAEEAWAALENPQPMDGRHTLGLETSADTWVEIFGSNDQQLEMDLVRAGDRRAYRDTGPFRIVVGRASAVVLTLDGEAVNLEPHTEGGVASLVLATAGRDTEAVAEEPGAH